ncbi:conjugal transfer protein TraN [Serratia marcescens]|uniref:conjugal transfer protein TraN n=1 Tax=Serratia marcescens TaxID=615 RepID=UPI001480A497|nr:conjugal transfer protein TraN [Serratia marcescens]
MTLRQALSRTLLGSLLAACSANPVFAGDNDTSEGEAAASAALSGAQKGAGQVKPEQYFDRYTDNPPESGYYQGGTQTDTDIGAKGQQALAQTELGKEMRKSFINNPADKIDYDSDMIKRSDDIRKDADVIAAGVGPKCVKQVVSKVTYTSRSCRQAKNVSADCRREAHIETREKRVKKQQQASVHVDMPGGWGTRWQGKLVMPIKGRLLAVDVSASMPIPYNQRCNKQWGSDCRSSVAETFSIMGRALLVTVTSLPSRDEQCSGGKNSHCRTTYRDGSSTVKARFDVNMDVDAGQSFPVIKTSKTSGSGANKGFGVSVTLTFEVEETVADPVVTWTESCTADKSRDVLLNTQCVAPGGNRTVTVDGQNYTLYQDCWAWKEDYQVFEDDENSCQRYENDKNCTVGTRSCLQKVGDFCVRESISYQCQHTVSGEGWLCGDKFYCDDGSCASIKDEKNNDFKAAVSQLAALAAAGKDVAGLDPNTIRFFTGKPMSCRKTAIEFSNCCKGGGWGHGVGLAHCNDEEKAIGKAKERKLVIDVGEYCSKKVLGACLQKKHSYCVYDSLLARIVQEQGRQGQLGIGFGSGKSPDCRGMVMAEFERLKFDRIDFSDFYDELQGKVKLPDQDALSARIREQISRNIQKGSP